MHPRTTEVLSLLDLHRVALERAVDGIPPLLRERRAAPEHWSVAEVLQHLALVEGRITLLLTNRIDAARAAGLGPDRETSPIAPTLDLARVLDRSRPIVASEPTQPRAGVDAESSWAMLVRQRETLRALVVATDGLALEDVSAPNAVLGPLNAYQWMVFVAGHEARHTAQIREIAAMLHAA